MLVLPPQPGTLSGICKLPALQDSKVHSCSHLFLAPDQLFLDQCELQWK